jgi:hypothetical protein
VAGVEVLPCRYDFRQDGVTWLGTAPVETHEIPKLFMPLPSLSDL